MPFINIYQYIEIATISLSYRWNYIADNCKIPKSEFLLAVQFVLNSIYFIFNNIIYQQIFEVSIGSPFSYNNGYCFAGLERSKL